MDEAEREFMHDSIKGLVELNLLRYTADGFLSLHSQVVYNGMQSYLSQEDYKAGAVV